MKSVLEFARAKRESRPIALVTAYDAPAARTAVAAGVDALLVGDSVAMTVHGHDSTLHATVEMMVLHTAAVRRGAGDLFVVADLPFLSTHRGEVAAVDAAGALMRAGANAVKLEGLTGQEEVVARLIAAGIPVMGHLGLTPQSVHQFGGYRVQAREEAAANKLRADAARLEELGAFSFVLECVPAALAAEITRERGLAVIGIGAGRQTDGQVLVWHDVLGLNPDFCPKFARRYTDGFGQHRHALEKYTRDVRARRFPANKEVPA